MWETAQLEEASALEAQFVVVVQTEVAGLPEAAVLGLGKCEEVLDRLKLHLQGSGQRNSRSGSSLGCCGDGSLLRSVRGCRSLGRKRSRCKEFWCTGDVGHEHAKRDHGNPILGEALPIEV